MNEETISLSNFTAHNWFSFISAVNSVEKHASLICHWALCCVLDWRKYPHKTKTLEFINLNIDCVMKTKHSGKVHISITLSLFKMNTRLALFNFKSILNVKSIPQVKNSADKCLNFRWRQLLYVQLCTGCPTIEFSLCFACFLGFPCSYRGSFYHFSTAQETTIPKLTLLSSLYQKLTKLQNKTWSNFDLYTI